MRKKQRDKGKKWVTRNKKVDKGNILIAILIYNFYINI